MKKLCTTLKRIEQCNPCTKGWKQLLRGLGKTQADDEPLAYSKLLELCGLADAVWLLQAEPQFESEWRIMAIRFARTVSYVTIDKRSLAALDIAERYARGQASKEELAAAYSDAYAAYSDAAYKVYAEAAAASDYDAASDAYASCVDAAYPDAAAAAYAAAASAYPDAAPAAHITNRAAAYVAYATREKIFLEIVG